MGALALGGCSSFSASTDFFASAPEPVALQVDSRPAGATATTADGQSCRTPCGFRLEPKPGQSVTFTLDRHLPQTVPLQVIQHPGPPGTFGFTRTVTDLDPNPVFAELQPTTPPRKARKPLRKRRPAQPAAAEPAPGAAAPPPSGQFPTPAR